MVKICNGTYFTYNEDKMTPYFENFGFPLSDFQKYAIEAILNGEHTLVTAHTGSGKTLPVEFAIRHFVNQGKKVIYTSPIKALSNQKFYEFSQKFPDIRFGIFTGDIKVNPIADVLIMTTEILMNYLFQISSNQTKKGHIDSSYLDFTIDVERDLSCVIFDEVHYINDVDRGNVWEQTILMLPPKIQMVMLSATIDKPEKFAAWVENRILPYNQIENSYDSLLPQSQFCEYKNTNKEVWIASTDKRVVPLTHYTYMTTNESIFKHVRDKDTQKKIRDLTNNLTIIKTPQGEFIETAVHEVQKIRRLLDINQQFVKRKYVLNNLTKLLKEKEMLPAIAFVFSRKNVEVCAREITTNLLPFDSKVPYTIATECHQIIRSKFSNYNEYLELPEYQDLVKLMEKGIAIHHSGMIPVLREIVEFMISKKYIMLLFATESFAIGLDCPIKTTIFTSITKYDGKSPRLLYPHEYTQMAGRAGRRGIDTIGHIVHCNNLYLTPSSMEYRELLCGKPQQLVSKFEVSYDVVMNIIKYRNTESCKKCQIVDFVKRSMMAVELDNAINAQTVVLNQIKEKYEIKKEAIEKNSRTPREACEKWILYDNSLNSTTNKKRKETERILHSLCEQYRWIKEDSNRILDIKNTEREIIEAQGHLTYLTEYIENQISHKLQILLNRSYIQMAENEDTIELTLLGKMSLVTEIPCLIAGAMMQQWNRLCDFGHIELVCAFSCFVQIKVADDLRKSHLTDFMEEDLLRDFSRWVYESYKGDENYNENDLTFDLVDVMRSWYLAKDERECKEVIQGLVLGERGISVGDFTKAVLKISKIANEFKGVCENIGEIELMSKLSEIDGHILKYMITAQSLYV
jgi:superfamily II RNA helicase